MNSQKDRRASVGDESEKFEAAAAAPLTGKELEQAPTAHLENKVKELHSNVRHITQLGMTWFGLFMGINYLTIGWYAKKSSGEAVNRWIILVVALVFLLQNVLGVFGILQVKKAAETEAAQVRLYESWLLSAYEKWLDHQDDESDRRILELKRTSIPSELYASIASSLIIVLGLLCAAWAFIFGYYLLSGK